MLLTVGFKLKPYLRDHAFKLKPLSLSNDLIAQLRACASKLGEQAECLQKLIHKKKNKNKHYQDINSKVVSLAHSFNNVVRRKVLPTIIE